MRVAHVITRMIVGGAQENTLFNCLDLQDDFGDEVLLITGPSLGPEGDLITNLSSETRLAVAPVDCLRREIHPRRDWQAYRKVRKILAEFKPEVVHTHSEGRCYWSCRSLESRCSRNCSYSACMHPSIDFSRVRLGLCFDLLNAGLPSDVIISFL